MNKSLPDKWVRKAIYDAVTAGPGYEIYDSRQPSVGNGFVPSYILMSVQSNTVVNTKCEDYFESTVSLEVVNFVSATGNVITRATADDMLDGLRAVLEPQIVLDVASGLEVVTQIMNFPSDVTTPGLDKNIVRKFLTLNLKIE